VLTSGNATSLSVPGYSKYDVAVKQCSISMCIDYGALGALMRSASRTSDGDEVTFNFDLDRSG
jgi:hypothetical protein